MVESTVLENTAREYYEREWPRLAQTPAGQFCPGPRLLRDLLGVIAATHDLPLARVEPHIRRLILDQTFVDEQGDPCMEAVGRQVIDAHVCLLLKVVQDVRHKANQEHEWSSVPAPPPMFG